MFKELYLGFNSQRDYLPGDKIIKYNNCATKINLYQCIEPTSKEFNSNSWVKIGEEETGFDLCRGYRADYLGACARNIVIRDLNSLDLVSVSRENIIPFREKEIYFDNITFI